MTKYILVTLATLSVGGAFAQQRDNFVLQQTQAEMQRLAGQVDSMQSNFEDFSRRLNRLEGGGDTRALRAEIEALKAELEALRRQLAAQRTEIVRDLSKRMADIQRQQPAPVPARTTQKIVIGPHREYVVQSGDTLSLIAKAFNTNVAKLREMNGLTKDTVRVGQKLRVPKD